MKGVKQLEFITAKEIAEKWKVSERMVRKYCTQGRIKDALLENGIWYIPQGTRKPPREKKKEVEVEPVGLARKVVYQRRKNNHFGIYEYIQVNLAYSSSRMASNRLTRKQVLEVYRAYRITPAFEATKVDDIIEIVNHFICVQHMVDQIMKPLTIALIQKFHALLTYGTFSDRQHKLGCGEFRSEPAKLGIPPNEIVQALTALIREYERRPADLQRVLEFHVRFEKIPPFEDYNGRVGRVIMVKECLRYEIDPFIIDDKHRGVYNRGIASWDTDPEILFSTVEAAQERLRGQLEVCKLMEYHKPNHK